MARTATTALAHARDLLHRHILVDGHNDLPWAIRIAERNPGDLAAHDLRRRTAGHTDLPRLRRGGVGGQFWCVYVPSVGEASRAVLQVEQIELARRMIARYPRDLALCSSAREVRAAFAAGRIASLLGMEGGHVIENSLGALRGFHELGARYMTLTHNGTTDWADSATDAPRHGGLSPFGRGGGARDEPAGHAGRPVPCRAGDDAAPPSTSRGAGDLLALLGPRPVRRPAQRARRRPAADAGERRRRDGHLRRRASSRPKRRAIIVPAIAEAERRQRGVTDPAQRRAISREVIDSLEVPISPLSAVADHVEHVARVAGVEHVGLGGDFDGSTFQTDGLRDVSGYPNLFAELIARGWINRDLARLAGGSCCG